jgi:hypothetical protein
VNTQFYTSAFLICMWWMAKSSNVSASSFALISNYSKKGIIGSSIQSFQGWPFPEILIYTYQLVVEFCATCHWVDFNRSLYQFLPIALEATSFL